MLTAWWPQLPVLLFLLAVLWLPGLALLWAFGRRTAGTLLMAPAFSVAAVGVTGVVLDLVGIRYSLLSQAVAAVVLAALAWAVGRVLPRGGARTGATAVADGQDPETSFSAGHRWLYPAAAAAGLAAAAVLLLRRMVSVIGHPEAISQRWDNIFHLNAIRWVVETGSGSTLTLNRMVEPDRTIAVYPAAWHQIASLAVPLTGDDVFVAHNLTLLAVGAVVWPASCLFLARVLLGPSPVAAVAAGTASAGLSVFPMSLMGWGPLFPNLLALALLPVALGLLVLLLGPALGADPRRPAPDGAGRLRLAALLVVAVGALFVSQPNAFLALLVVGVPLVVTAWWLALRAAAGDRRTGRALALLAVAAAAVAVWLVLWNNLTTGRAWQPFTTFARGVGEALLYATNGREEIPWVLVLLTAAGVYAALGRRRLRWLVVGHFMIALLFAVAAGGEPGPWRSWLTGGWYVDSYRLAATLPVTGVPLAALGTAHVVRSLAEGLAGVLAFAGRAGAGRRAVFPVAAVVVLALVVPYSQMGSMTEATQRAKRHYAWEGPENLLTLDELELLKDLDELTDPDEVIAINPWNGGALAFAVGGRPVTQYHIAGFTPQLQTLVEGIDDAAPGSPACQVADELEIGYVLDFGTQFIIPDEPNALKYSGLNAVDPATDTNLELVERSGGAALYEVVGCG